MCYNIGPENLKCEEGEPVYNSDLPGPEGVPNQSCLAWCVEMQDQQHLYFLNPKCLSEVNSCEVIEEYRKKDPSTCKGRPLPEKEPRVE